MRNLLLLFVLSISASIGFAQNKPMDQFLPQQPVDPIVLPEQVTPVYEFSELDAKAKEISGLYDENFFKLLNQLQGTSAPKLTPDDIILKGLSEMKPDFQTVALNTTSVDTASGINRYRNTKYHLRQKNRVHLRQ
ncbi:MAG: hypothetical protein EBX41_07240 [Chitinophagia bacterium]|nr:hypothetical protein [Chitinophagia bacterium]